MLFKKIKKFIGNFAKNISEKLLNDTDTEIEEIKKKLESYALDEIKTIKKGEKETLRKNEVKTPKKPLNSKTKKKIKKKILKNSVKKNKIKTLKKPLKPKIKKKVNTEILDDSVKKNKVILHTHPQKKVQLNGLRKLKNISLVLTQGELDNHYLRFPKDFFPQRFQGGSNISSSGDRVLIKTDDGSDFYSDYDASKGILRTRFAIGAYFIRKKLKVGSIIKVTEINNGTYLMNSKYNNSTIKKEEKAHGKKSLDNVLSTSNFKEDLILKPAETKKFTEFCFNCEQEKNIIEKNGKIYCCDCSSDLTHSISENKLKQNIEEHTPELKVIKEPRIESPFEKYSKEKISPDAKNSELDFEIEIMNDEFDEDENQTEEKSNTISLFNPDGSLKVPEYFKKGVEEKKLTEKIKSFIEKYWDEVDFDCKEMFLNMIFISSFNSKRNLYYIYEYNKFYIVCTGIKNLTRFNLVPKEDVEDVLRIIKEAFPKKYFCMEELQTTISENITYSKLITFRKKNHIEDPHLNSFYYLILSCCYVLVAKDELISEKYGRKLLFCLNNKIERKTKKSIFEEITFIAKTNNTTIFQNNKFYFDVKCKNFRGSIFPYLILEIDYLKNLVLEYPKGAELDIEKLISKMDYQTRFHDIYQLIIDKNLRNDREAYEFFEGRLKAVLKIIKIIYNILDIEKEGRKNIYLRRG